MPRTEVYQLRLTSDEKADLAQQAREEGLSIAGLIREWAGFEGGGLPVRGPSSPPPESRDPRPKPQRDKAAFEQRVKELRRTMPASNARRLASKELRD